MSDVKYPCPTAGDLIGAQDDACLDRDLCERIAKYIEAVQAGREKEWLHEQRPFWVGSHEVVVSDLAVMVHLDFGRSVRECERCGRLHVQAAHGSNEYHSFVPDEPGYKGVLRRTPE